MKLKRIAKKAVEQLTGTKISRTPPRGIDFARDIAHALPTFCADIVFDVGANVGQSAKLFLRKFPHSRIYCFEPVGDTFRQLRHNLKGNERIDCYQLALGSSKGTGTMALQRSSEMFFLLDQSSESPVDKSVPTETADVLTVDEFCRTNKVDRINYLKIDTEGWDLDVLRGAATMLAEQRIDLVQVEAGMNPANRRHVSFETLKAFLESRRYFLFGIYDQVNEWPTREPHLRRTNPVFLSAQMIEKNKRRKESRA